MFVFFTDQVVSPAKDNEFAVEAAAGVTMVDQAQRLRQLHPPAG